MRREIRAVEFPWQQNSFVTTLNRQKKQQKPQRIKSDDYERRMVIYDIFNSDFNDVGH